MFSEWSNFDCIMALCNICLETLFSTQSPDKSRSYNCLKPSSPGSRTVSMVVNLKNEDITEQECSLLKKGLNFAITPDLNSFITPIQSSLQHLSPDVADAKCNYQTTILHQLRKALVTQRNILLLS